MLISEISDKINKIFPLLEGQNDWDNIGVLIDTGSSSDKILLTIDISDSVLNECIRKGIKNIISYHPVIFSGLKKITEHDIVRKLIKNDINVFSPHTSWDKEMNEYIKNKLIGLNLNEIIDTLKRLANLNFLRVAGDFNREYSNGIVVGVGSAFRYHSYTNSIIITGEMSHHCLLHSVRNKNFVILMEHSNSERITLPHFKDKLQEILTGCEIIISEEDKDPVIIL